MSSCTSRRMSEALAWLVSCSTNVSAMSRVLGPWTPRKAPHAGRRPRRPRIGGTQPIGVRSEGLVRGDGLSCGDRLRDALDGRLGVKPLGGLPGLGSELTIARSLPRVDRDHCLIHPDAVLDAQQAVSRTTSIEPSMGESIERVRHLPDEGLRQSEQLPTLGRGLLTSQGDLGTDVEGRTTRLSHRFRSACSVLDTGLWASQLRCPPNTGDGQHRCE